MLFTAVIKTVQYDHSKSQNKEDKLFGKMASHMYYKLENYLSFLNLSHISFLVLFIGSNNYTRRDLNLASTL